MNQILISVLCVFLSLLWLLPKCAYANDSIFPPQPAAQAAIDFDAKGFLVNGQRVFLASAGMEYARVPQELWADRLQRFKRAGFNCIEIYVFWNYHEAKSGQFDFSGNRDLDAFLKLARSFGLYAIVRVGPYCCAEWDSGGYPVWLRSIAGLEVRTANGPFQQYVTRFFDQLLPIVMRNQIHRGGNVILVQLENEHSSGWGTDGLQDGYFRHLQSVALSAGLEVPYFFSGLHHDHDPAGSSPWSSALRTNPWFSTEFWCDWYDQYGETEADARAKDWATWKILAYGGNGYNYYMAHGGSNFDYFNDDENAASYDYGAAVGQTGDLRPEYYKFKRAAWFARSFQSILETSDDATSIHAKAALNPALWVTARKSSAGTILFLGNPGSTPQSTRVVVNGTAYPQSGLLTVNPSEIMPVVTGCTLLPGVTLTVAPSRILGILRQASTTSIVIYGQSGSAAELYFQVPTGTTISSGAPALSMTGTNLMLRTTFPSNAPANFSFQVGSQRLRILAVNDTLVDKTWFVDVGEKNFVVTGPRYVGDAAVSNGCLQLWTETPWQDSPGNAVLAYGPDDAPALLTALAAPGDRPGAVTLSAWQTRSGITQAAPVQATNGWLSSSSGPQQMGADGDVSNCAWYRTTIDAPSAGSYTVCFGAVADHMQPFVDGIAVPASNVSANSFTTTLEAGSHTVAVFTAHYGRNKLVGYIGPISKMHAKGLSGTAYLLGNQVSGPTEISNWKVMSATSAAVGSAPPAPAAQGWSNYTAGSDAFNRESGYAWFQTVLPTISDAGAQLAAFSSVDDNAWVYLNGIPLATNVGWNVPFQVELTRAWQTGGSNVLSVLVQNTANIGGINTATFSAYQIAVQLNHWTQQGGPRDPNADTGWQELQDTMTFRGPQFFKSSFTANTGSPGTGPMWRVTTTGLSHGSVWVNGHNLGRYPERIPAPGIYIPECWLKPGPFANTLVIYDEGGNRPNQVRVQPETQASRDPVIFQGVPSVSSVVPPPPIGLIAEANSTEVRLRWNASPGAKGYNIKRGTLSGAETTVGGSTDTNYTDSGLLNGITYYYVVSAVGAENESANSGEVTAVLPARDNLSANRTASADSQQPGNLAYRGNDENPATRWCANDGNADHWWQVDLGSIRNLSGSQVLWEKDGVVYNYVVAVSSDNAAWTTVVDKRVNTISSWNQIDAFAAAARYVRITVTGLAPGAWASFYEFRVFGPDSTNTSVANGCYHLFNRNSAQVLDAGGAIGGASVGQSTYTGGASQTWTLTNTGSLQYKLVNAQSGLAPGAAGNSTNGGIRLELVTPDEGTNQKWRLRPASEGWYMLQSVQNGLFATVLGASTAEGTLVELQAENGPASQWSLHPVAHLPMLETRCLAGQLTVMATLFQGQSCVLETSTNLWQWRSVVTNATELAGQLSFSNPVLENDEARFYRVRFEQ